MSEFISLDGLDELGRQDVLRFDNFEPFAHWDYRVGPGVCKLYGEVPKGLYENLEWRKRWWDRGMRSQSLAREIKRLCAEDLLFWVNTFVWTYDPRREADGLNPVVPFITYPAQDWFLLNARQDMGVRDAVVRKSRDWGASWMVAPILMGHRFLFQGMQSFLLASRTRELVDVHGTVPNLDTLMGKFDFLFSHLPPWMLEKGAIERRMNHRGNKLNRSILTGAATTADIGAAGRRTALMIDEFARFERHIDEEVLAATQAVSRSRFFVSTPKGPNTAFSRIRSMPGMSHYRLHWSSIPSRRSGAYRFFRGKVVLLDGRDGPIDGYDYRTDGKLRSPYFDAEDDRMPLKFLLEQEYNLNEQMATNPFFDVEVLKSLSSRESREPTMIGNPVVDDDTLTVRGVHTAWRGPLRLWIGLDSMGNPPSDRVYKIGADIATGTSGASNSVLSIGDARTNEKVGEYVSNRVVPEELARIAVALCRWFRGMDGNDGAELIWELNGPGMVFGQKVWDYGWRYVYFRKPGSFGWVSNEENKESLLANLRMALDRGFLIIRDEETYREACNYVYEEGKIRYSGMMAATEGRTHGDRVISAGLMWMLMSANVMPSRDVRGEELVIPGTLGYRQYERRRDRERMSSRRSLWV